MKKMNEEKKKSENRAIDKDQQLIRFDWAIKRLLRNKADHSVLEGFLTSLLGRQIKIKSFIESEGNKRMADEKSNRVDISAEDVDGNKIIIEVQNQTENEYFHRILFGTSRMIIDHVKEGEKYDKVPKVYSVNIVFFDLGDRSDYVYHGFTEFKGLHTGEPLLLRDKFRKKFDVETPGEILPEYYILLANDFNKWSKTPIDQWMYFLSTNTIPEDATAPGLQEAREQLSLAKLSKEERRAYFKHLDNMRSLMSAVETAFEDGEYEGIEKGLEQGRAEGRKEQQRMMAKKMLGDGLPLEKVALYSGLSEGELSEMING